GGSRGGRPWPLPRCLAGCAGLASTPGAALVSGAKRGGGPGDDLRRRWIMWRRYAFVRQNDQSDCGAAALATIALHHRRPVGLQQMRELAGTDRIGTNLLGLLQAAERLGFSAKAVKGPYEGLGTVPLPTVAHTRTEEGFGHFVVLHRVGKDGVIVADPGR